MDHCTRIAGLNPWIKVGCEPGWWTCSWSCRFLVSESGAHTWSRASCKKHSVICVYTVPHLKTNILRRPIASKIYIGLGNGMEKRVAKKRSLVISFPESVQKVPGYANAFAETVNGLFKFIRL